jgi:predicted membrane channel-forming protein YqfA (hemolysin III family)
MPIIDSIIAFGKKYLALGIISQVLITAVAAIVALIEGFILFIVGVIIYFPGPKYGPPPTPEPIIKYGPPVATPDQIMPALHTPEGIFTLLVVLGSLFLYAWTIFGWVFWGSILYLKTKEKKEKK